MHDQREVHADGDRDPHGGGDPERQRSEHAAEDQPQRQRDVGGGPRLGGQWVGQRRDPVGRVATGELSGR